jgi:hypothetical protein
MILFYNANKKKVFFQIKITLFGFEIKWRAKFCKSTCRKKPLLNMEFKLKFGIIVGDSVEASRAISVLNLLISVAQL